MQLQAIHINFDLEDKKAYSSLNIRIPNTAHKNPVRSLNVSPFLVASIRRYIRDSFAQLSTLPFATSLH